MTTKTQMQRTNQQVRGFVLIWTFITLIMGLATFLAIYFAYQPVVQEESIAVADSNQSGDVVVIASSTPLPVTPSDTPIPLPTMTPTTEQAVATDLWR